MIQSAGVIVVDYSNKLEPRALCVRAYSSWDFPKGKVEGEESLHAAAVRELCEETSISLPDDATWDLSIDDGHINVMSAPPITYGKGSRAKTVTYFLASRTSKKEPSLPINESLGRPENDEWRWVEVSKLEQLMPLRLAPVVAYLKTQVAQS